jgi:hypothetical protein
VTTVATDLQLLEQWEGGLSYREIASAHGLNADSVRGRVYRAKQGWTVPPSIAEALTALGEPLHLTLDSVMVTGDWQIPTTDCDMVALMLEIARRYMKRPRHLIIAGDFINADAFSGYEPTHDILGFSEEVDAARALLHTLLGTFDHIYWSFGNHERRVTKRSKGALTAAHVAAIITHSPRVTVSPWSHITVNSSGEVYRVTHPRNYSVNALKTGDALAQKFQSHIIGHHEHHVGKGHDRFKRYVVVNNGGMFAAQAMGYALLDDSTMPNMQPGFTLLADGVAEVFTYGAFTNWARWLPDRPRKTKEIDLRRVLKAREPDDGKKERKERAS